MGRQPILLWKKSFPGLILPASEIPSELMPHLRYPEVLFDAQRQILSQFHVQQPASFYGGQNFWAVPDDPTGPGRTRQPAALLHDAHDARRRAPEFSLMTTFTPRRAPTSPPSWR